MSMFLAFQFNNQSGLSINVILEAPIGTQRNAWRIEGGGSKSWAPCLENVNSSRVTVTAADGSEEHNASQDVEILANPPIIGITELTANFAAADLKCEIKVGR